MSRIHASSQNEFLIFLLVAVIQAHANALTEADKVLEKNASELQSNLATQRKGLDDIGVKMTEEHGEKQLCQDLEATRKATNNARQHCLDDLQAQQVRQICRSLLHMYICSSRSPEAC